MRIIFLYSIQRTSKSKGSKLGFGFTWTPKVCKIMAFIAMFMGLRLLFYLLLGFR